MNVGPSDIIERLDALLRVGSPDHCVVTFDGDGTLWAGDVSEDVFAAAIDSQMLKNTACSRLAECANAHGLLVSGSASSMAQGIFNAYRAGNFPESVVCEVMTWCYAGLAVDELVAFARETLAKRQLATRYNQKLLPILEMLRLRGVRSVVISASPKLIVDLASAPLGFDPSDVVAATPSVMGALIQPQMEHPTPYAQQKVAAGRRLFGGARWLGCFGDNVFDTDMLREAELAVAVAPKPALRRMLGTIPGILVLD